MLFNSWRFAIFLPIVFILYWALPHRYRWILLFAASYYFYMSWNVKYVVLILFTTAVSYFAAIFLEKTEDTHKKKLILWVTLIACLGVLFVFKYFNWFFESLSAILSIFTIKLQPITLKWLLPVGISFYTFQTLSYVIDVYRGKVKAEHHFGIYATFISFFPQLVAGPIERTQNLLPQIKAEHHFSCEQATYGLKLMAVGFFKKMVVADNFAPYVDTVFADVHSYSGFALLIAAMMFAIQIYCDFSGYSDIARGTSKLMGIELMENFKSPFLSSSVKETWGRWHISLTSWFRDYVYIPLGGSRCSRWRYRLNIFITFLVSGLWHGASWTYVFWGGLSGLGQIFEDIFGIKSYTKKRNGIWVIRVIIAFTFFYLCAAFFRAETISDAFYLISHIPVGLSHPIEYLRSGFTMNNWLDKEYFAFAARFLIGAVPLLIYDYFSLDHDVIAEVSRWKAPARYALYFAVMIVICMFRAANGVTFVYFQF